LALPDICITFRLITPVKITALTIALLAALALAIGCASTPENQYASASTPELKLRHTRLMEVIGDEPSASIKLGEQLATMMVADARGIERELLRRYQAGDQAAHLPIFDK
jgi:hypothetical protein